MPAKNGIAEEEDTAMPVVVEIVGVVIGMVEVASLFLLRSPFLFLPSDMD
jgi:hypothetical protein